MEYEAGMTLKSGMVLTKNGVRVRLIGERRTDSGDPAMHWWHGERLDKPTNEKWIMMEGLIGRWEIE